MVEAPGTAPGSVSPILNSIYCHSSFKKKEHNHHTIFLFIFLVQFCI